MEEIKTPTIEREIGKRISQTKKAYTIYRNKQIEIFYARKQSEKAEVISQLENERKRLAIKLLKAQNSTRSFVSGINELLIWDK